MDVKQALQIRESCRSYDTARRVDRALIEECVSAAGLSPSSCNTQPWHVVAVDEQPVLDGVRESLSGEGVGVNKFVGEVPAFLCVVKHRKELTGRAAVILERLDLSDIDIGIFVQSVCLRATELGLSSCIIGWIDQKKIQAVLNIPEGDTVPIVIALGYAKDGTLREKRRHSLAELLDWNSHSRGGMLDEK